MTTVETLKAARRRIADPANWCKGTYARNSDGKEVAATDADACQFCAYGALIAEGDGEATASASHLRYAARSIFSYHGVIAINDGRGHKAVLELYDAAIAAAEAEGR